MPKKWLSQLARRYPNVLFSFLSSLRRFVAGCLGICDRRQIAWFRVFLRFPIRSQGDIAGGDAVIHPSHLPLDQISLEVAESRPSPSDVPYLRQGSRSSSLEAAAKAYSSMAGSGPAFSSSSLSSLHPPQHMGESHPTPTSLNIRHDQKGKGIGHSERTSANLNPSLLSVETSSMDSSISARTSRSTAPSLVVSESRRSEYRRHKGQCHSLGSTHSSMTDLLHPSSLSVSSDLRATAIPVLDIRRGHLIARPGSDGQPCAESVILSSYEAPQVDEMVPGQITRYDRTTRPPKDSNTIIPAKQSSFPVHSEPVPDGWISVVHPEGSRYFFNQGKRTFTESNICDPELQQQIGWCIDVLLDWLEPEGLDMSQIDLVIEANMNDDLEVVFCYYFANHRSRCIFWLDDFNVKGVISECLGVQSLSHQGLAIQAQYWRHWDYFPSLCPVSEDLVSEVSDMLMHAKCDHVSSKQSSAPCDAVKITDYISVVDRIKVLPADQGMGRCHAAIVIGRIMHEFSHNAFINFHGEDCARLSFDQTVHGWEYKPSWWMVLLTPILCLESVIQVQELHKIFTDHIARESRWNEFNSKLRGQLQDSNLLATVLLNANVAFLGVTKGESVVQMASYLSLVTSFGSIVLGLFFVSQDRTCGHSTAEEAGSFLSGLHHERHGLEWLAVFYSLPKALLMWGVVFFFLAFSMNWYTPGVTAPKLVVGVVTLFVFVMLVASIIRTKERHYWWSITRKLLSDLTKGSKEVTGADRPQSDTEAGLMGPPQAIATEGIGLTPMGPSQPNIMAGDPMHTRTDLAALPDSPMSMAHQSNSNTSTLHLPHSRLSPSLLQEEGYLQEDTRIIPQPQPTGEAHSEHEPDHASLAANEPMHPIQTNVDIPSEHDGQATAEATGSGAATMLLDSLGAGEERDGLGPVVVAEPQEYEGPQVWEGTTSPPIIIGRGATDEAFRPAPAAKRAKNRRSLLRGVRK